MWALSSSDVALALKCLLLLPVLHVFAEAPIGPGVIRMVHLQPPSCKLDPDMFVPEGQFYVAECPQGVETATLDFESPYDLLDADNDALALPLQVHLEEGQAKLVVVSACGKGRRERICTTYEFDVHRGGSSQATLQELLVSCGSLDAELTPGFEPSVTGYEALVPYGSKVLILAEAAHNGFVSFDSFSAAQTGRAEKNFAMKEKNGRQAVDLYVVSADRRGRTRYRAVLTPKPNTDAGLESVQANVGRIERVGGAGSDLFALEVPKKTREVAISASAADRQGATVKVGESEGTGYASTVLALHERVPYQLVHLSVEARDHITRTQYIIRVFKDNMATLPILSSLIVPGCIPALEPAFQADVHKYRCLLGRKTEIIEVTPIAEWTPSEQGHPTLRVNGEVWRSGQKYMMRLDTVGGAKVQIKVTSADRSKTDAYSVLGVGFSAEHRGPAGNASWVPPGLKPKLGGQPTPAKTMPVAVPGFPSPTQSPGLTMAGQPEAKPPQGPGQPAPGANPRPSKIPVLGHPQSAAPVPTSPAGQPSQTPIGQVPLAAPVPARTPGTSQPGELPPQQQPGLAVTPAPGQTAGQAQTVVPRKSPTVSPASIPGQPQQLAPVPSQTVGTHTSVSGKAPEQSLQSSFQTTTAQAGQAVHGVLTQPPTQATHPLVAGKSFPQVPIATTPFTIPSFKPGQDIVFFTTTTTTATMPVTTTTTTVHSKIKPLWKVVRNQIPTVSDQTLQDGYRGMDVLIAGSCLVGLIYSPTLAAGTALLKNIQFLGLVASMVNPMTIFWRMSVPFGLFNCWTSNPFVTTTLLPRRHTKTFTRRSLQEGTDDDQILDVEDDSPESLAERENAEEEKAAAENAHVLANRRSKGLNSHAGAVVTIAFLLPVVVVACAIGWHSAAQDEEFKRQDILHNVGHFRIRAKLLPCTLFLLDAGLIGFTNSVFALLAEGDVEVRIGGRILDRTWLWILFLFYPLGFCMFWFIRLCQLRRNCHLVWSPLMQHFVDTKSLAINLHGPSYSVASATKESATCLPRFLLQRTIQNVVPLLDPEGGPLQLDKLNGRVASTPDGCLFNERKSSDLEAAREIDHFADLLPSKTRYLQDWQKYQERLGILSWTERRCAIYNALRIQINDADAEGKIVDCQGNFILDYSGDRLGDLYQYCIYQFPSRPWRWPREYWASCLPFHRSVDFEPVEKGDAVLAHWVPSARGIFTTERQLIDTWLNRWMFESEKAVKAREMLLQLRWRGFDSRAEEDQSAILRGLAYSVLMEEEMETLGHASSSQEADEHQTLLDELVLQRRREGRPPPWQNDADRLLEHELQAVLNLEYIGSSAYPFGRNGSIHPALEHAVFATRRLRLRTPYGIPQPSRSAKQDFPPRVSMVSSELQLRHLRLFADWFPVFDLTFSLEDLSLPVLESWHPLFTTCSFSGAPAASYLLDAFDRAAAVVFILVSRTTVQVDNTRAAMGLLAVWRISWLVAMRVTGISGVQHPFVAATAYQVLLCVCLVLREVMQTTPGLIIVAEIIDELCILGCLLAMVRVSARGWAEIWCRCLKTTSKFRVLAIRQYGSDNLGPEPKPAYGQFRTVEVTEFGEPLSISAVVPSLGLCLKGQVTRERCSTTDERRLLGCRKRLAVYQRPLEPVGFGPFRPRYKLSNIPRFNSEIQDYLPVVLSREQLAGSQEIRELVCTVQVVNHVGKPWCSSVNDSYFSLHLPWGLDTKSMAMAHGPGATNVSDSERRERYRQTVDSPGVVRMWREELSDWLYTELAASSEVEHTALDSLLAAGRSERDAFRTEADKAIVPGIFSDDGIGEKRYSDSRSYHEGRVLHYTILSSELKSSLTWRPDPLAAQVAELLCGFEWRPCLLRLASRSLFYALRSQDGKDHGGTFPEWGETPCRKDGDYTEFSVSFFFLDRISVDVGANLVTLYERDRGLPVSSSAAIPDYAPRCLPLVFRVDRSAAYIWESIVDQYRMSRRPEHIVNYSGPVIEHPLLPGVNCRHGIDGEQLWDDGSRYIGDWQGHVYHGKGHLLDAEGNTIYKGEWQWGMKHGHGSFYYDEGGTKRAYTGQWQCDEFFGDGELWVMKESCEVVRRTRPHAILRFKGRFNAAEGQFPRPPDFLKLDLEKHAELVKAHFPLRPALPADNRVDQEDGTRPTGSSSLLAGGAAIQFGGEAPFDHAASMYKFDGADVRHCGPDENCEILYADGTQYTGPCIEAAIPHGAGATMFGPDGSTYEGGFDRGLRAGIGTVTIACGIVYTGEFAQPGGQRHGNGITCVPEESNYQTELGYFSYEGQYAGGLRVGYGVIKLLGEEVYKGEWIANRRHGTGTLLQAGGASYNGPWKDDRPSVGHGEILYETGQKYVGEVNECQRSGEGKFYRAPIGNVFMLVYSGQWLEDEMHGQGELHTDDGCYKGNMKMGKRHGHGSFEYKFPERGSQLPVQPSARMRGELSKARIYEGTFEQNQPQGTGDYTDEYGYQNKKAQFAGGHLSSDRRPPLRTCTEKWVNNPGWPAADKYAPTTLELPPDKLPRGALLCKSRGKFSSSEPIALRGLDVGRGNAHGRTKPAHMGLDGVPGTRWA